MLVSQMTTIFKNFPHCYAFIGHEDLMFCWQLANPGSWERGWRPRSQQPGSERINFGAWFRWFRSPIWT